MAIEIKNHKDGTIAEVTKEHQILTRTENHELQHHVAWHHGETFQVQYDDTGINAENTSILHIKNNSSAQHAVISYIRLQAVIAGDTGTRPANTGHYFQVGVGSTVLNGDTGSAVKAPTPVNTNRTSGKTANLTAVGDGDTGGTFTELDKWYAGFNGEEQAYNKQGSLILGQDDTFEIRLRSVGIGAAKARVTLMMLDKDRD